MRKSATPSEPIRSGASRQARRAAAVSTGALMLCLFGAGPAWASISPDPLPTTDPLPTVLPSPTATAVPIPSPVQDAVQQVTQTLGVSNPVPSATSTATSTTTTTQHTIRKSTGGQSPTPTSHRTTAAAASTRHHAAARGSRQQSSAAVPPAVLSGFGAGSFAVGNPAQTVQPPVTAPVVVAPMAVAHRTDNRPPTLADVLGGPGGVQALRIVLLALATTIVSGIAVGHVKNARAEFARG